nr:MAG TPA: HEMOGLOBIN (SEA CUCUMBER) TRANSPORT [Caudoviricetes sp.]
MRFYSDVCHKLFESQEELEKAEKALAQKNDEEAKKKAERKADADKVQKAHDEVFKKYDEYCKLVDEFVKKYGSYHTTIDKPIHFNDVLRSFADVFWF